MKQKFIKLTSSILITTLLFAAVFVISSGATESDEEITCLSDHFSKLNCYHNDNFAHRIPVNAIGTCGQVAMSMVLSYYDFYWNDIFVPTIYDSEGNSHEMGWREGRFNADTGIVTETFSACLETSKWNNGDDWDDFKAFAEYHENEFLHPYLVQISNGETINGFLDITTGLLGSQCADMLQEYLNRRQLGEGSGVSVHYEEGYENFVETSTKNRNTLFETMKEQINNGNPVILFGFDSDEFWAGNYNEMAHIMVAFDIVENADGEEDILIHNGWNTLESNTEYPPYTYYSSTPYNELNSIIWIEIDENVMPHVCSDAYKDQATDEMLCTCQVYASHPAHSDNHKYRIKVDNTKQYEECICGDIRVLHYHDFSYTELNENVHLISCNECSYSEMVNHKYILMSISSTQHQEICACGHIGETSDHIAFSYENYTKQKHKAYCKCGYYIGTQSHSVVTDSPTRSHCIYCEAIFNPMNDFVILKKDPDYEDN